MLVQRRKSTGMEEKVTLILNEMAEFLSVSQMRKLQEVMLKIYSDRNANSKVIPNEEYAEMLLNSKRIEGCSERTIQYYGTTIYKML